MKIHMNKMGIEQTNIVINHSRYSSHPYRQELCFFTHVPLLHIPACLLFIDWNIHHHPTMCLFGGALCTVAEPQFGQLWTQSTKYKITIFRRQWENTCPPLSSLQFLFSLVGEITPPSTCLRKSQQRWFRLGQKIKGQKYVTWSLRCGGWLLCPHFTLGVTDLRLVLLNIQASLIVLFNGSQGLSVVTSAICTTSLWSDYYEPHFTGDHGASVWRPLLSQCLTGAQSWLKLESVTLLNTTAFWT